MINQKSTRSHKSTLVWGYAPTNFYHILPRHKGLNHVQCRATRPHLARERVNEKSVLRTSL